MRGEGETRPSLETALVAEAGTRTVVRAAAWMLSQQGDLGDELWRELWHIGQHAKSLRTRRMALAMFADRVDPLPRVAESDGLPKVLNVALVLTQPGNGHAGVSGGRLTLHLDGGDGASE